MKKVILYFIISVIVTACTAGKFEENRIRLHNMGHENICKVKPERCIDGTDIEW